MKNLSSQSVVASVIDHVRPARARWLMLVASLPVVAGAVVVGTTTSSFAAGTSTTTLTQVSASSITLGPSGTVSDTATVQGTSTNGSPSGGVSFYICQTATSQTLTRGPCAATADEHLATTGLSAGAHDTSSASSGAFTPTAAGTWCFSAVYGGSSLYATSTDNTTVSNLDANECVLVTLAPTTTGSSISSSRITLGPGGSVSDAATVVGNVVGGSPTGGVAFYVCHTSITATLTGGPCPASGTPEDAGVALAPGAGATASVSSTGFVPTSVGTWCFSAVYGGSSTYATSGDNTGSSNLDANECVLVAPPSADAITSDPNVPAVAGRAFTFLVTTSGSPVPTLRKRHPLPKGVSFVNNHNGTGTLSGTPNIRRGIGVYHVTITATFGHGKSKHVVTQALILTVP